MNLYNEAVQKALVENEIRVDGLLNYKKSYDTLVETLKYFEEQYSPKILVPVCPKLFMRGKLVHTNEILVSLGSDYFLNCSTKDAIGIAERRIKKSDDLLKEMEKEHNYLTGQMEIKDQAMAESGQEIIEPYDEEAERKWKEEHRKKMKEYRKKENIQMKNIDDEEIMNKLEYLQLKEEIENMYGKESNSSEQENAEEVEKKEIDDSQNEKLDRKTVKQKLEQLRKNRKKCVTENDIFERLDELEEEEYLEDLLEKFSEEDTDEDSQSQSEENSEDEDDEDKRSTSLVSETKNKRRVSFADIPKDDKTSIINFSHSSEPSLSSAPLENKSGVIQSPTDIYNLYSKNPGTKSIIKNCDRVKDEVHHSLPKDDDEHEEAVEVERKSVYIGNILEKSDNKSEEIVVEKTTTRPISKFKAARLASKKKQ